MERREYKIIGISLLIFSGQSSSKKCVWLLNENGVSMIFFLVLSFVFFIVDKLFNLVC